MNKILGTAAVLGAVVFSSVAFAAQSNSGQGNAGQGNSTPGIDRYESNPGRERATEVGAQCDSGAGSGAFGYFGVDNNLAGGADGQQTGINNSSICGNR